MVPSTATSKMPRDPGMSVGRTPARSSIWAASLEASGR